jgi:hypothetical protein
MSWTYTYISVQIVERTGNQGEIRMSSKAAQDKTNETVSLHRQ